jgi:hypothetical protein
MAGTIDRYFMCGWVKVDAKLNVGGVQGPSVPWTVDGRDEPLITARGPAGQSLMESRKCGPIPGISNASPCTVKPSFM